ncbi:hypothetical protein [Miniphocaeibacter massiliensis]|uniref:hypothetical protein n=1 Tax=Miniphocaeibacter massiliensis TaxID=2041841 RepID=UPI000C1BBC49|nr:hypothetical protein [Miniphocaeibacter massiliensis]
MKLKTVLYIITILLFFFVTSKFDDIIDIYIKNDVISLFVSGGFFVVLFLIIDRIFRGKKIEEDENKE